MHGDDVRPGIDRPRRMQHVAAVLVIIVLAALAYWLTLRKRV